MSESINISMCTVLYSRIMDGQTSLKFYTRVLMDAVTSTVCIVTLSTNTLYILQYAPKRKKRVKEGVCVGLPQRFSCN